jgi:hypothetical protein
MQSINRAKPVREPVREFEFSFLNANLMVRPIRRIISDLQPKRCAPQQVQITHIRRIS